MRHEGFKLMMIDAADRGFMGYLGLGMAYPDDRLCAGDGAIPDDFQAVHMATDLATMRPVVEKELMHYEIFNALDEGVCSKIWCFKAEQMQRFIRKSSHDNAFGKPDYDAYLSNTVNRLFNETKSTLTVQPLAPTQVEPRTRSVR